MKMLTKPFCLALATVFLAGSAAAIPLSYDEGTSGDIADQAVTFSLDFGANTVTGNVSNLTGLADFDKFSATLPTNAQLDSIALSIADASNGNGLIASTFEAASQVPIFSNLIVNESIGAAGLYLFNVNQPLSEVLYVGLNTFSPGISNDYTITLNVSSTSVAPLPGGLMLYLGMLGLGAAAWRKTRG